MSRSTGKLSALVAQFETLERDKHEPGKKTTGFSATASSRPRSATTSAYGGVRSTASAHVRPEVSKTLSRATLKEQSDPVTTSSSSGALPTRPLLSRRSQSILDRMAIFDAKSEIAAEKPRESRLRASTQSEVGRKSMEKSASSSSVTSRAASRSTSTGTSYLAKRDSASSMTKRDSASSIAKEHTGVRRSSKAERAVASRGDSTPTSQTEVARSAQPSTSSASGRRVRDQERSYGDEPGKARPSSRSPSLSRKQKSSRESSAESSPRSGSPVSSSRRRKSSVDERVPAKAKKSSICDSPLSSSPASSTRRKRPSTDESVAGKARKPSATDSPLSSTRRRKSSVDEGIATATSNTSTSTRKSSSGASSPASRRSSAGSNPSSRKSSVGQTGRATSRPSSTIRRRVSSTSSSDKCTPGKDSSDVAGKDADAGDRSKSASPAPLDAMDTEIEEDKPARDDDGFGDLPVAPRLETSHQSHKISVAPAGRRKATQNPVKALKNREDVIHDLKPSADQVGKQIFSKSAQLAGMNVSVATTALAGLAAKEDVSAVKLSAVSDTGATVWPKQLLIHIKGRRSLQTRLVEPKASSVNSGDSFLFVDSGSRALYQFIGKSANVVERAKSADMAMDILHGKDCGCKAAKVTVVEEGKISSRATEAQFWKALTKKEEKPTDVAKEAGDDMVVEKELISTTVVYELEEEEIVLRPELCGKSVKYAMLDPKKVMVFDFVNEVVSWTGRRASNAVRRSTAKLTKEVFDRGYIPKEGGSSRGKRPDWAQLVCCKDGSESILFRSKVQDWPDPGKVINTKASAPKGNISRAAAMGPCDGKKMRACNDPYPGLVVLQRNLGRGSGAAPSDDPCLPGLVVKTESVKKWKVKDNTCHELDDISFPDFYEEDAYIVRWEYSLHAERSNIKSGVQCKQVGSNQNIFFYWQGNMCRISEKGTAALIVVELSGSEGDPQIRVAQGSEPPAFLQMFNGAMAIHRGSSDSSAASGRSGLRLYAVHGTQEQEGHLEELPGPVTYSSLRTRHSFLICDTEGSQVYLWHGKQSPKSLKPLASKSADLFANRQGSGNSYGVCSSGCGDVTELNQGDACRALAKLLPDFKDADLDDEGVTVDSQRGPRMFVFGVASGSFDFHPLVRQWRYTDTPVSFPATQSSFYGRDQPGIGLVEAGQTLYVWCGWMPEIEDDRTVGGVKSSWLEKRDLAFRTAMSYLSDMRKNTSSKCRGVVVTAGCEPQDFRALFLHWEVNEEAVQAVRKIPPCSQLEPVDLEEEMEAMRGTTYPLALLRSKPLPDNLDVDPKALEKYLNDADFEVAFSMSRDAFDKLPAWKQLQLRKKAELF